MFKFLTPHLAFANRNDVATITTLLNSAYRGESAKQGWTHEANLITGNTRTDESTLLQLIEIPHSVVVKYTNDSQKIIGCVNLQQHENKLYLGMLSVLPNLQGGGIGKQLLKGAEEYALHLKCATIYMTVISLRSELIDWYQRHGYKDTGDRKVFIEDNLTGKHLTQLEFMTLEKEINF